MSAEHFDFLVVGAGLSGIGAAYHVHRRHPGRTYAVLEARGELGGTWSLFRYPGIRSDSDMHTLGFSFHPWTAAKAIADGPSILAYLEETAATYGIDRHIRYGTRVVAADWSSPDARWTVRVQDAATGEEDTLTCAFLLGCTGYYRYDRGHTPHFEGRERFPGPIVHPQHWPEDLDFTGKHVTVIGSGATAVTLVPALVAQGAAHATMLQRSPSYIASLPSTDDTAERLRRVLPERLAFQAVRWKNILRQIGLYQLSRRRPATVKRYLRTFLARQLPDMDLDLHFTPRYDPWDQRLCLVPDGDLFRALRKGTASVVTDRIESFTERGIALASGEVLETDVIVTATGLELLMMGGVAFTVDGERIDLPERMTYKGMMLEGVPNFAFALGYTNASWTLKADLTGEYVARLLAHMDRTGAAVCTPVNLDPTVQHAPLLDFDAGYVKRAEARLPKAGTKAPWRLRMNYALDLYTLRFEKVDDGVMRFTAAGPPPAGAGASAPALAAR
jgi:monooxygenase